MTDTSPIERLAGLCGLESEYWDYRGEHRRIPNETRRAILHAMGFDTSSESAVLDWTQRVEAERWRSVLPPVVVVHNDGAGRVPLALPDRLSDARLRWSIRLEDGNLLGGEAGVAELPERERVELDGEMLVRRDAGLPGDLPPGYHVLSITVEQGASPVAAETRLIVAPPDCATPTEHGAEGIWGLAVQLYALRSERNWGIGDFGDLKRLARVAATHGIDMIGLNPLHALYPANPAHISPYSPSSRTALNVMYIDVPAVPGYADCAPVQELVASDEFGEALAAVKATDHVDYVGVARLKFAALRLLFAHFQAHHVASDTVEARRFGAFVREGGAPLERHATYDALHAHFLAADDGAYGFRDWPEEYRDPRSEAVTSFGLAHRETIDYYLFLQWLADDQLGDAQAAAREAGMRIGLYRDLAVGVDSGGSDVWSGQDLYCTEASVGAPPDPMALHGQDWGLPPLDPRRLKTTGYQSITQLIRANMRHCGALRIDHVMALLRLWWLPREGTADNGVYVYYPFEDLLGVLCLESRRSDCLVVGEDLGTVPDRIREALPAAAVLSYRVMIFEKHGDGSMKAPHEYPAPAMATVTTHDLPMLYTWWEGGDVPLRDRLNLFPNEQMRTETVEGRAADRRAIVAALGREGMLPDGLDPGTPPETLTPELAEAVLAYLARSNAALMVVQPEDWLAERRPINVPGTSTEHANWSRKLNVDVDDLFAPAAARALAKRITDERARRRKELRNDR